MILSVNGRLESLLHAGNKLTSHTESANMPNRTGERMALHYQSPLIL